MAEIIPLWDDDLAMAIESIDLNVIMFSIVDGQAQVDTYDTQILQGFGIGQNDIAALYRVYPNTITRYSFHAAMLQHQHREVLFLFGLKVNEHTYYSANHLTILKRAFKQPLKDVSKFTHAFNRIFFTEDYPTEPNVVYLSAWNDPQGKQPLDLVFHEWPGTLYIDAMPF